MTELELAVIAGVMCGGLMLAAHLIIVLSALWKAFRVVFLVITFPIRILWRVLF